MGRNRLAGKSTGKSKSAKFYSENEESRKKKQAYDTRFHATKARRKYRSKLAKANREAGTYGNHDGLDMAHKGSKIVGMKSQSANRGSKSDSPGDRRARGRRKRG